MKMILCMRYCLLETEDDTIDSVTILPHQSNITYGSHFVCVVSSLSLGLLEWMLVLVEFWTENKTQLTFIGTNNCQYL